MPVRKFRASAVADLPAGVRFKHSDAVLAARAVHRLSEIFSPIHSFPPGVYRFRNIEEAQAQKKSWMRNAIKR